MWRNQMLKKLSDKAVKAVLKIACSPKKYPVRIIKDTYRNNGALALEAYDDEGPFATLSVNLPGSGALPKNQCYIKTYSENEGLLEQLVEQKVVKEVGLGYCSPDIGAPFVEVLF
jgi:hypothetical protein